MSSWFIQGLNCNRAIDGDVVAVQLLPEEEWTLPERVCSRNIANLTAFFKHEYFCRKSAFETWRTWR